MVAACSDAEAAEGLAAAYVALPAESRARFVAAVEQDARLEGVSPAVALAALLGAETEPEIARSLYEAIRRTGGEGLTARTPDRALGTGDTTRGSAVLIRPLFSGFSELLHVTWDPKGVTEAGGDPLLDGTALERRLASLPAIGALGPLPFDRAVDRVATVLWRHIRRHGAPPAGLHRFAALL